MLFGLGLANHQTLILLVPLPLWAAWCGRNEIEGAKDALRTLCIALVLLLLAFALPYLHVVLASADQAHWKFGMARTPSELIDVIDRHVYGSFRLVTGGILQGGSPAQRVWVLVTLAGWPYLAIVAGLAGLAMRRRYAEIVFAALIVAGPLVAFCALANMSLDQELWRGVFGRFGLLPLVALAPFSAAAAFLLDLVRDARVRTAGCAVVLAAAFVPAAIRLPAMALAGAYGPRVLSRDLFAALPQHAILLATTDAVAWGSTYFQATENLRPDVTVVINGFLPFHLYRNQPWADLTIPSGIGNLAWSNERRDLLARANPSRPFFVANDDFSVRSASSQYTPLGEGLVSHVLPTGTRIDARSHFLYETALQLRPGYADVDANFWRTNGFGSEVRGFYADCFFDTALDAKKLRNRLAAQFWLQRARNYASEPRFDEELRQL
jgi:hypothetical protein